MDAPNCLKHYWKTDLNCEDYLYCLYCGITKYLRDFDGFKE